MIIGIDAGCLGISDDRLKVGVYRMAKALLGSLAKIDHKNTYRLYSFKPIEKKLLEEFGSNFHNVIVRPAKGWFNIWLPLELNRKPVDVFIGLSQSLPRLPKKTKSIVFIHDLTFEKYAHWFPTYKKMSVNSKKAVSRADQIIAVSKGTKKDLINLYKIPQEKITVIYESFDQRLKKISPVKAYNRLKDIGITKPFFLFAGTFKQSKNIPNIIRAFSIFSQEKSGYELVLVGSNFWLDTEINVTVKELKLENSVRILGFTDDKILEALYTKAEIFISPSFNEGFGLTYLEAAYFKLPVICSANGSVKEVLGKGGLFVHPESPEEIARAISQILTNTDLRKNLVKNALQNISQFSWEKSSRQLLRVIKSYEKV